MSESNGECSANPSKAAKKLHKHIASSKTSSNKEIDRRIFVLPGKLNGVYTIMAHVYHSNIFMHI